MQFVDIRDFFQKHRNLNYSKLLTISAYIAEHKHGEERLM